MSPDALETTYRTFQILLPEILVVLTAVAMMTGGAFGRLPRKVWCLMAVGGLVAGLIALFFLRHTTTDPYTAVALNDEFSGYARLVLLLSGLLLLAMAHDQVNDDRAAEFFGSFLLIIAGAMLVATANELVFLFVGLELISIPTYLLLYLPRRDSVTQEAATKYFFLSIFSSALLLFGLAYLYGLTGVSNLKALAYLMRAGGAILTDANVSLGMIAVLFVMAGLGFRVAAVPFHFYAPDVYQGAPTIVTAMLAWIPKAVGFLAMLRALTAVVSVSDELLTSRAILLTWLLAVATMTLGNTVALMQDNLKRLLAYSSIAHAGYLLIGVTVAFAYVGNPNVLGPNTGIEAILIYLVAYALMTLGAFAVILELNSGDRTVETVDDMAGLGVTRPGLALGMTLLLFSLAGIPPLMGFWGKFFLFYAAWGAETPSGLPSFRLLAIIGVLNAAIGAYYYLRIVMAMYLRSPQESASQPRPGWPTVLAVGACSSLSLLLGLYLAPVQSASRASAVASMRHEPPRPIARATPAEGMTTAAADVAEEVARADLLTPGGGPSPFP
ncbi:NADH-quinone oxidoreductase subunit N [soil metagenome]